MSAAEQQVSTEAAAATAAKKKTEYEKVTMSDGRVVEFPKNRKLSKQSFIPGIDGWGGAPMVRLDFANGETRDVYIPGGEIIFDLLGSDEKIDAQLRLFMRSATHGMEQKLGDEMAYSPTKKDEPDPTLEDKIFWVDELIDRIKALEWTAAREGGGLAGVGKLVQALMELGNKTKDEIKEFLTPLSKEDRAAIKKVEVVKLKIREIEDREEAAKAGTQGAALLGGIGLTV